LLLECRANEARLIRELLLHLTRASWRVCCACVVHSCTLYIIADVSHF
jgi:hypothetical protein